MKITSHIGVLLAASTALGLAYLTLLLTGALQVFEADRDVAADSLGLEELESLEDALHLFSLSAELSLESESTHLVEQVAGQAGRIQVRLEQLKTFSIAEAVSQELTLISARTESVSALLDGLSQVEGEDRSLLKAAVVSELEGLRGKDGDLVNAVEATHTQRAESAAAERTRLMIKGIVGGLIYVCLLFLLWRWTARTVIDPLNKLTAEASMAEEGIEKISPLTEAPEEVRVLARTISGLVDTQGQQQEVLEETVKTRTQELSRANEDLLEQIVQRERAEEALKRHDEKKREDNKMEALGRLAGGVAHDFNNLLTAIVGYSDLILSRMSPDDPEKESLQQIRLAGERASVLTRQLLLLGRNQVADPVSLSLGTVAKNMEKILQSMVGEKVSLSVEVEPELPAIEADEILIEQVLMNLTVNAKDAVEGFGSVKIRVGAEEDDAERRVFLLVEDDGAGMTEDVQGQIFEPYFSTKQADKGTGLGLTIVYGIVQQSGGRIEVESSPGKGTTMKLIFPVSEKPLATPAPPLGPKPEEQGTKRILLVEDEDVVRSLASSTLQYAGYSVSEACDGAEAVEVFAERSGEFDLVITDVVMPRMGGRELMRSVAVSHPDMKVLYMSGHIADEELQAEIVEDGVPYLPKPFRPSELTKKVVELLSEG